jgi:hypothetical protein
MTNYAPLATTLLVLALCGCSAVSKERFSHRFHRLQYRLTDEEVKGLQFYISSRVLAQVKSSPDVSVPTSSSVIVVPKDTPGVATHVGRDWIKVTYREGGTGVVFFSDTTATNDIYLLYSLATNVEGADNIRKVADVPGNVLLHDGTPYTVVEGYDSILMVDVEQLQELIDKRKIGAGVKAK